MTHPATSLDGRHVLITGGSMGIGYAAALACLRAGANVTIAARTAATVRKAAESLGEHGAGRVAGVCCDVSDASALEEALDEAESRSGRVNGLIHAAAVLGPIGPVTDVGPDDWLEAIRINLFGTFLTVQHVARRMAPGGGGRMVLFSGGGASGPFPNYTAYACSKVAVVRFSETVAIELAPVGIEVNCLAPGFVATRMHEHTLRAGERAGSTYLEWTKAQLQTGGVPADVAADAAAFLVSDQAAGITGRFVAAAYDDVRSWPEHAADLSDADLFTLRRVLPEDKGLDWQ